MPAPGEDVKDTAEAAGVSGLRLLDGDVAGIVVGGGELHSGLPAAGSDGDALLVRHQDLVVLVQPAHLADGVSSRSGDVAAQQEGSPGLYGPIGCGDHFAFCR